MESDWDGAGRDGRTHFVRPNYQARTGTGKKNIFPLQLTTSRIGNLTRLIHTLLKVLTIHTYRMNQKETWEQRGTFGITQMGSTH